MQEARSAAARNRSATALAGCVAALAGCGGSPDPANLPAAVAPSTAATNASVPGPAMRFTTLSGAQSGIDMVMTSGEQPSREILEVNGGGLALFDFDDDGDLDLFVANGATMADPERGPGCRLYENIGAVRFRDVTGTAGIDLHRWAMGVSTADYDGDGDEDLYVTCFGPDVLLRNDGGRFTDVTAAAGLGDPRWETSSAWGDLDGDGDLDLYVVNYLEFDVHKPPPRSRFKDVAVMAGPHGLVPQADALYENLGNGTFRDVTADSGCAVPASYGLGVVILDFDGDRRPDIFVGNDSMPNHLFHNLGGMHFQEVAAQSGVASNGEGTEQATMGIGIADVDDNGRPDIFVTVFSSDNNTLFMNLDGRFFDDRTARFGLGLVSRPFLGWCCGFFDFDQDGDEDLLLVNGHVYPEATMQAMDSDYQQVPLLFQRSGKRFERVTDPGAGAFLLEPRRDRAAAFGDLDGDGDVDVAVGELNGPVRVLRNDSAGGPWLTVELRDPSAPGNRRAVGAQVKLEAGGTVQRRWIYRGGYQSANPPVAHFGLPAGTAEATLEVTWPDGAVQRVERVTPGRRLVIDRAPK